MLTNSICIFIGLTVISNRVPIPVLLVWVLEKRTGIALISDSVSILIHLVPTNVHTDVTRIAHSVRVCVLLTRVVVKGAVVTSVS